SIGEMNQMLFPIYIEAPDEVNVAEVGLDEAKKQVTIDAKVDGTITPDATLTARIPKALIDNVASVARSGQGGGNIDFTTDDSNANFTAITIDLASALSDNDDLRLSIIGTTTVVPEFPSATVIVAVAVAATITMTTLRIRKKGL